MEQLIKKDIGGRLELGKRILDGSTLINTDLSSVQVKLLKPGQNNDTTDPLQDWTTASVISTGADDGLIYYDVSALLAADLAINYTSLWKYTASSRVFTADTLFHVVMTTIDKLITADDLNKEEPTLNDFQHITETIKNDFIEIAYNYVVAMLKGRGRFPWAVFNDSDVNIAIKYFALYRLAASQSRIDDVWLIKTGDYKDLFDNFFATMSITYADNLNGVPEKISTGSQGRLIR